MLDILISATFVVSLAAMAIAYRKYGDVFHPLLYLAPMFSFIYGYLPLRLIKSGELFTYISEEQAVFTQFIFLSSGGALFLGCLKGSERRFAGAVAELRSSVPDSTSLRRGAYGLGLIGMLAWVYTIWNVGGIREAFGRPYGGGWSEYGYARDATYLTLVALLLLISPWGLQSRNWTWRGAVIMFSAPWFINGIMGARRGPTFIIVVGLVISWFIARGRRPAVWSAAVGGVLLGALMLFLVSNRSEIYFGSEFAISLDIEKAVTRAGAANEYIFGSGQVVAARQLGSFYWGRRWLAQIFVRPVPRQLWPTKYADVGVPEHYVGLREGNIADVLGWTDVPGAAPGIVADLWVEWYWLAIPAIGVIGWVYGAAWRRAVARDGYWSIQYVVLAILSVYLIAQSMEAVLFRVFLLSIPALWVWRQAISTIGSKALQDSGPAGRPSH